MHFHKLKADPDQIAREFATNGKVFDTLDIVFTGKHLGLKIRAVKPKFKRLAKLPCPFIAETKDQKFFLVLAIQEDGGVVIQAPPESPQKISLQEFEDLWSGQVILAAHRSKLVAEEGRFGFTWFIPALVKYRKILREVLLASFMLQMFGLVTPLFFQAVVDKVLVHQSLTTLNVLLIGMAVVALFEVILGGLRTYIFSHTTSRIDVELGSKLFRHLLGLPLAYFESRQVGQTVARIRELENIREFLTSSALTVVLDLLFGVVFFTVMFFYSTVLTLIILGSLPLYIALSFLVTPVLRRRIDEKFHAGAVNQSFLVESVTAIETIKSMAVEPQMRRRWDDLLAAYIKASFRTITVSTIGGQGVQLISKTVNILVLWIGAKLVIEGEFTVGQLIAFNMLAGQVYGPILRLSQLWQDFQQMRMSVDRLGDVLNVPTEPQSDPNKSVLPAIKGEIIFEHVSFRYHPDGSDVLSDLSFTINAGEVVAFVGESGSGKSTIAKLIQRLYVPNQGKVLVDGVDLALIDPQWLRKKMGVVLQENILFNRSIRDNIALADPAMSSDAVIEAARMAGAHNFILEQPQGYDTILEERGSNLSGGQRQRVAIARSLAASPSILVFDEATSALDYESETEIKQNMKGICEGRTVIIVAHRLSTVRDATKIFYLRKGRVLESGSHEELLERKGAYSQLYNLG